MKRLVIAPLAAVLLLAGCSSSPGASPIVEKIPTPAATASPSPTIQAEKGTRTNPLAVGEQRSLAADSMWTVGASAASKARAGHLVLPLHLSMDWAAAKAQGMPDGSGADPFTSLHIEYVAASGRSYTDTKWIDIPNQLDQIGTVYPPAAELDANYVATVPETEIPGGVWKVSNGSGDSVFLAAQ